LRSPLSLIVPQTMEVEVGVTAMAEITGIMEAETGTGAETGTATSTVTMGAKEATATRATGRAMRRIRCNSLHC
jgi:hypothetical protein